jgi:LmbE family N-acetylglucosaminyl deacetylase
MRETSLTILAIFAHPDDEIGAGATIARYSDAGHRIILVCATRGEAATIFCDGCATRETLAEVRTHELECACRHLGIGELRWLDWPDGGIQDLPRADAIGQIVRLIREIQPDVILTHPETGIYPHPDHLAVWGIVREAFDAAADDEYSMTGQTPGFRDRPWAAARLFTRVIAQNFFDLAPAFAQYRVQLNGQQLPFIPTPDDQIDVTMQVEPWVERRMAAWDCHRSQHNPDGAFANVPEEVRRALAAHEQFILAAARVPLPEEVHDDLLAGLERGQPEPVIAAESLAALHTALTAQRAYLAVCETYARQAAGPDFKALLQDLAEGHQEAIYALARALRQAGAAAGEVGAAAQIVAEGARQKDTAAKVGFLAAAVKRELAIYQAQAAADPGEAAIWRELTAAVEAQERAISAFGARK